MLSKIFFTMIFRYKIILLAFTVILNAQRKDFNTNHDHDVERFKWEIVKKNIEAAVYRGEIKPEKAQEHYNFYRQKEEINLIPRKDTVLENHFKKLGIEDIKIIKNQLVQKGIGEDKLDAVLGGILRLTNMFKSDNEVFEMYPRMESYFKTRLSLSNAQVQYIIKYSKKLAGIS